LTDRGGPHDVDRILAVRLGELDVHALGAGGGEVLAHVVRPDGQLPVAAVHEHREPHRGGASDRAERVESGTDGAAGEEDVVHQDDDAAVDAGARHPGGAGGAGGVRAEVVAVHRDVQRAVQLGGVLGVRAPFGAG